MTVSSPVLQHQLSASSPGLKSILKQRSLSNPSSTSSLSPTNERKSSTNYVSPLASNETRPALQITSTNNRSSSIDSQTKRTPPTTPTEKKKSLNPQDNSIFTNDIDERQTDEKKSTWRTPPTKQTLSNESNNTKKPTLDKIPKKPSAAPTTPKPVVTESTKPTTKVTKPTKQPSITSLGTKVPQLTLERLDAKSLKTAVESTGKSSNKLSKLKRTNVIQRDSDTDKKSNTITDAQKPKKSLLNNQITKRKQQHQQKPITTKKPQQLIKPTTKPVPNPIRKQSTTETHSSASDNDEKKMEVTGTSSDHEQASSDNDDKMKKDSIKKRTSTTTNKNKPKFIPGLTNRRDIKPDTSMYDRIKKRARSEQTRTGYEIFFYLITII